MALDRRRPHIQVEALHRQIRIRLRKRVLAWSVDSACSDSGSDLAGWGETPILVKHHHDLALDLEYRYMRVGQLGVLEQERAEEQVVQVDVVRSYGPVHLLVQ
jgi:hypothetical protein